MQFPSRDLTNQYISSSYQDVLQQYSQSDFLHVLDGYGNVVWSLPSASVGQVLITSDVTASMTVATASYSITQSYVTITSSSFASSSISSSYAFTASVAHDADSASVAIFSTYSDSSSLAIYSDFAGTSSIAIDADSASYALTASYALNGGSGGSSSSIPPYDYTLVTYNGPIGQVDKCIYKMGGISGSTVCIITPLYSGNTFTGISKSFG